MSLKPARKTISKASTCYLLPILLLAVLYILAAPGPLTSLAQTTGVQPQSAEKASRAQPQSLPDVKDASNLAEKWGIEVTAIRLTAAGSFIDFRYRIVDPEKAKPLMAKDAKATLVDHASGKKLSVPATSVGTSRSRGEPITGRNYFVLFTNSGGIVRRGSKVTVTIGEFKVEDLSVQ